MTEQQIKVLTNIGGRFWASPDKCHARVYFNAEAIADIADADKDAEIMQDLRGLSVWADPESGAVFAENKASRALDIGFDAEMVLDDFKFEIRELYK